MAHCIPANNILILVLAILPAVHAQPAPAKIAIINGQGALVTTQQGKSAFDQWRAKVANKQKEFDARASEIAQLEEQLNKSGTVMTADRKEQLTANINDKKKRFQRDAQDAQEETQQDEEKALQPVEERLNTIISKYAADKGYTVVVDVSAAGNQVRYFNAAADITKDVVALYDKTYPLKP